jgi:biotin carboxyl carrier protein
MTRFEVDLEISGLVRSVQITPAGDRLAVVLDGRPHSIDAAEIERGRWSLLFEPQQVSHEVLVRTGQPGELTVLVDGAVVPVRVRDPRRVRLGGSPGSGAAGPVRITAPMPGRIVRVLVGAGEIVAARQGLVVVEAMKMENELRAPCAGTVHELRAREGTTVDAGALLLTIA